METIISKLEILKERCNVRYLRDYIKLKSSVSIMTTSLFIDENLNTYVLQNVQHIPEGYTKVTIDQVSNKIISLKYNYLFYNRQFSSFMVSNKLLNTMQESANVICMTLIVFKNDIFRLKFKGTVEELLKELKLAPTSKVTIVNY